MSAACPARHDAVESVPADAGRARVTLGGTASLFDGRLRVTFEAMERGGSFADVTLSVAGEEGRVTEEITVVRQAEYSDPVRLGPWIVRAEGFPGVDAIRVVAWREAEGS